MTPIRRMIAEAMVRSVSQIPHAWSTIEVDVTSLVALRAQVRPSFEQSEGIDPLIFISCGINEKKNFINLIKLNSTKIRMKNEISAIVIVYNEEKVIREALESLKGKFAIFMVAHRLKTVHMADKIIVIGEGKILEQGTWSELINKPSGTFRRMAQLQGLVKPSQKNVVLG